MLRPRSSSGIARLLLGRVDHRRFKAAIAHRGRIAAALSRSPIRSRNQDRSCNRKPGFRDQLHRRDKAKHRRDLARYYSMLTRSSAGVVSCVTCRPQLPAFACCVGWPVKAGMVSPPAMFARQMAGWLAICPTNGRLPRLPMWKKCSIG